MTNAWHEAQQAIRALRKSGDVRHRLIEAYRALVKVRGKDLPNEVRHDHEWLIAAIDTRLSGRTAADIRERIDGMTPAQLSEAVHRIARLHDVLKTYQPVIMPTAQKQAACRALLRAQAQAEYTLNGCVDCNQCELF